MRRAVTHGHGWYGFALDVDATARCLEALQLAHARHERPAELGTLEISITPPRPPDQAMLEAYQTLGVARLIPMLGFYNQDNVLTSLDALAAELIR